MIENDPTIEILGKTCNQDKYDVLFCGETKTYEDPDNALEEALYSAALYITKGREEWLKWYKQNKK